MDKSRAIELLKQALGRTSRLRELKYDNQEFTLWKNEICDILEVEFGKNSTEYHRFATAVTLYWGRDDTERQEAYNSYLNSYETALKSIIRKYEILGIDIKPSAISEPKDTAELPGYLFDRMQFHPKVVEVSESLFKTGNYASAILEAFKAVHNYVQDKTGLTLDGVNLMEKVFNENKPILQLNELLTQSDKNEQKGFKYIFMGCQTGIRNPKAHEYIQMKDPNRTLEYLSIASLLMRRIDESKLVKLNIKEQTL